MLDPIRILLVDDSPYFLAAAEDFLKYQESLVVVGVATGHEDALVQAQKLQPQVILLDLNLGCSPGLGLIPSFREQLPDTKVIVLTMMEEPHYRAAALQAGADGFVHKSELTETLVASILGSVHGSFPARASPYAEDAAQAHEQSGAIFRRLAQHLPGFVFRYEYRPQPGFTFVSSTVSTMIGYTPEHFYADPDMGTRLMQPEDRERLKRAFQGGMVPSEPFECRLVRKDGSTLWTEMRNVALFDAAGHLTALEGIVYDITRRKQAEVALQKDDGRLRRVVETAGEGTWMLEGEDKSCLADAKTAEMEFNELKSLFCAVVSHEFRTPLSIILSSARLLERWGEKLPEEKRVAYLQRIQAAVMQMNSLLEKVLQVEPDKSGRLQCKPAPVDPVAFCQEIVERMRPETEGHHQIEFSWDATAAQAGRTVCINQALLNQILKNLLSNAVKYSGPGSPVLCHLDLQGTQMRIRVTDRGIGIPRADQAMLFEPFFRAGNVGNVPGTGLGLYIVKQAVDRHGGSVAVESEEGRGTTIVVELPVESRPRPSEKIDDSYHKQISPGRG